MFGIVACCKPARRKTWESVKQTLGADGISAAPDGAPWQPRSYDPYIYKQYDPYTWAIPKAWQDVLIYLYTILQIGHCSSFFYSFIIDPGSHLYETIHTRWSHAHITTMTHAIGPIARGRCTRCIGMSSHFLAIDVVYTWKYDWNTLESLIWLCKYDGLNNVLDSLGKPAMNHGHARRICKCQHYKIYETGVYPYPENEDKPI